MFINIGWNFLYKRFFYADNKDLSTMLLMSQVLYHLPLQKV